MAISTDLVELLAAIVAFAGLVGSASAYVTRLLTKHEVVRVETRLQHLLAEYDSLEGRHKQLINSGNLVLNMKTAIDKELALMADRVAAAAGAVFVPAPSFLPIDEVNELVFLSVFGGGGKNLRNERIPADGTDAGQVFLTGKYLATKATETNERSFSRRTDRASNFRTQSKASIPLSCGGKVIGVAQFLNKRNGAEPFLHEDLMTLMCNRDLLSTRVFEFVSDPDNFRCLGITPKLPPETASILFSDITGSSRLMHALGAAHVTDMLNQYFEALGNVAFSFGGNIDQYLGDGFMVSFNAKRPVPNHEVQCVNASVEMQRQFEALKSRWVELGYCDTTDVYNRIGISSGTVATAELGHSQLKHSTVMGDAVNFASALCSAGDRTRNTILLSRPIKQKLPDEMLTRDLSLKCGEASELYISSVPAVTAVAKL